MFTVAEAAIHATVSEALNYAWIGDSTLSHMRVDRRGMRGHIRIALEDLDGVLASFKVNPPSKPKPLPFRLTAT